VACSDGVGPGGQAGAPSSPPAAAPALPPPQETAEVSDLPAGVRSIFVTKCSECHGRDARGGPAAPNILELDEKHAPEQWIAYLKNPGIWNKKMPKIAATEDEFRVLGEWLSTAAAGAKGKAPGAPGNGKKA
jgi:mono/diheme cytochrome c family protein